VPVICLGLVLLLAFLLTRRLFDEATALTATGILLVYFPLRFVSGFAWSETLGLVFLLCCLLLLARGESQRPRGPARALICGLLAGLAFLARYSLGPLCLVGLIGVITDGGSSGRRRLARGLAFLGGFGLPAGWWLGHVRQATGSFTTWPLPSENGISAHSRAALEGLVRLHLGPFRGELEQMLFLVPVLAVGAVLIWQRRWITRAKATLLANRRWLLTLWVIGYTVWLVWLRSRYYFDPLAARLLLPAGLIVMILWAAVLVWTPRARSDRRAASRSLVLGLLSVASLMIVLQIVAIARTPAVDRDLPLREARRQWVANHTTDRDLIIGNQTHDLPFFLGRNATLSLAPYPYTPHLDYAELLAFLRRQAGNHERCFLLLEKTCDEDSLWRQRYGRFVADVVANRLAPYPELVLCTDHADFVACEIKID